MYEKEGYLVFFFNIRELSKKKIIILFFLLYIFFSIRFIMSFSVEIL